ncbi:MAG: type VI secretion system baseplate subunit TssG [Rhodospirillales bacterium]|nr:type VI secretion system baseplate subunit TssG [Rhodospirillales bacterium]
MSPRSVLARLLREPRRFSFDAAIRALMAAARTTDPAESARFRSLPGLAPPGADVTAIQPGTPAGAPPAMTAAVMGLPGATGVLPRFYSEVLGQTLRDRSAALHGFLDLLSHRMVAFFAGAGIKYRPHRAADVALHADKPGGDGASRALLAFTGYATPHLADRLSAGEEALLHYAGLFAMRPRSADRLAALVSDWLGRPVVIEQFCGSWLKLPPDQQSRMPAGRRPGQFNSLGVDTAIGVRAWDIQARIVLRVGPLDRAAFEALLPDAPALRRLVSMVRAYLGFETGFAINPILAAAEIPPLSMRADASPPPRLGWNTWMPSPPGRPRRDAGEAMFEAEIVELHDPAMHEHSAPSQPKAAA